ncbi:MAG: class I SAM-dependent methyltransferase [Alphaproteobacteria bacterium]|nr:class I SAM-dependent methyltransferase [Alphaproteobacteria bacterium]MCD8520559.1 class I SAM-dependent methyltransferase [Alphaproteobacteria bacterium]MCD8571237.1 class I SAM-dependent methyltransferase [Alphaproteobacteria bacterium]
MAVLQSLYVLLSLFIFVLIGVSLYYDHKLKIPPAPTLPWVRRKILKALKKHLTKDNVFIVELGSGWGGLSTSIARNFSKAGVRGFELSPFPYWFSKLREGKRVRFTRADIFDQDLSEYDAVVYYLSPVVAERLSAKFQAELKPGTIIVSNAFQLPGFEPVEVLETRIGVRIKIYVYRT